MTFEPRFGSIGGSVLRPVILMLIEPSQGHGEDSVPAFETIVDMKYFSLILMKNLIIANENKKIQN